MLCDIDGNVDAGSVSIYETAIDDQRFSVDSSSGSTDSLIVSPVDDRVFGAAPIFTVIDELFFDKIVICLLFIIVSCCVLTILYLIFSKKI